VITVGFGRVALFDDITEAELKNLLNVNFNSVLRILKKYYSEIKSNRDFYTAVIGSIAGHVSSPYFSAYGAAKAGLCQFVENVNIELAQQEISNRILDVSPGALNGTAFHGGQNDLSQVNDVAKEIITRMHNRETVYIPQYDEIYRDVIERYQRDPEIFGAQSYRYKAESGRRKDKPQVVVGYLSGTFDLFHVGHLNLLMRAKEHCDYLIVGIHHSGAWKGKETYIPFEERCRILESIRYVDKVVESPVEDYDAWELYHFDKLFVGSDYQGTERFNRYEELLRGKAEIIYFPYTKGTSSTQLRNALSRGKNV
jgi:glycerol-3-phosphate cytidylyltransferase